MTPRKEQAKFRALVHGLTMITGKAHSRIHSKMRGFGIKSCEDFQTFLSNVEAEQEREQRGRK